MTVKTTIMSLCIPTAAVLSGCDGILDGIYDEPAQERVETVAGELYIDASDWTRWHYLDLDALADSVSANPGYNTSAAWVTMDIPTDPSDTAAGDTPTGIYTYWYDVFGQGIGKYEYRDSYPTAPQPEPADWTLAVHRNNVRTNGCSAGTVTVSYPPYTLWKLSLAQTLGKHVRLTLAVDNIFNYKPKYYYLNCPLTDGANFMAGVSVDLYKD